MYNKKYSLDRIEEFGNHNPIYEDMEGKVCYLAYLNVGERGWFLYDSDDWLIPVHRVYTSKIQDVEYVDNQVAVTTQNTKFTFKLINEY